MGLINTPQAKSFKAFVLADIQSRLEPSEWLFLREHAIKSRPPTPIEEIVMGLVCAKHLTPGELVEQATTEVCGPTIPEHLAWPDQVLELGQIDGAPVNYIQCKGIYTWSREAGRGPYLSIWVSHPACPPGW